MEENRMESTIAGCGPRSETMVRRQAYVPPKMEVHFAEPGSLLAGTNPPTPTHVENELGGTNKRGELQTTISAKILDREFSFSDVWEE